MRLDKYLKVTRIVKRRTLAQELCQGGHVLRNGRVAKAASRVEVGDVLEVRFGPRTFTCEVIALAESADKKKAALLYRELSSNASS